MRKWVLVIDDEPELRETVSSYIELNYGDDVRIVEAQDGLEATSKLHFQAFSCIITDLNMPRKSGWNFIADARKSVFNENTPIVVISGHVDEEPIDAKHVEILHKPFKSKDLIAILDRQFKLGRTDQRVGADLINTVIEASFDFLTRIAELKEIEQGEPYGKKSGVAPPGDKHQVARIKVGKSRSQFVFGFSSDLLENLTPEKIKALPTHIFMSAAVQAILRFSIKTLKNDPITMEANELIAPQVFDNVTATGGVCIPIKTEIGELHILAVWDKR